MPKIFNFIFENHEILCAVKDAEVIMTCLPTHILAQMFEELIPYLLIGESMSLTYAARYDYEENDADIILRSRHNLFSAYPSSDTEKMMEKLGVLYDTLVPAANIIETALNNIFVSKFPSSSRALMMSIAFYAPASNRVPLRLKKTCTVWVQEK